MKYQFIEQHKHEFPIVVMCGVLGVSESGFYAWRKRSACQREREDAQLKQKIRQVFVSHQGRYGSPRILRELRDEGINCSRKRIARLMRQEELSARRKRHRVLTTKRDMTHPVAPNKRKAGIHSFSAEQEMGNRYYLYSYSTRMVVFSSHSGSVFKNGGGMEGAQVIAMSIW